MEILAAVAGGVAGSLVAGMLAYKAGRSQARDEAIGRLEERLRRVELRTAATRRAVRIERRNRERKAET